MPSKRPHSSKMSSDSAPDADDKFIHKKKPNPNPSPSPSPSKTPKPLEKSKPSKAAHPDSAADPDAASRKSQRKRKARGPPDEDDADGGAKGSQLRWADEDALALLRGVVEFRSKNGKAPISADMGSLFHFVKDSLHAGITQEQVYNKLRNLRRKYNRTAANGPGPTPYDQEVHELSAKVWGEEEEKKKPNGVMNGGLEVEADDGGEEDDGEEGLMVKGEGSHSFPCLVQELEEYWEKNGLDSEALKLGLKLMDPAKGKALEERWVQHLRGDLKLQMKRADLNKEICALLLAAPSDAGS